MYGPTLAWADPMQPNDNTTGYEGQNLNVMEHPYHVTHEKYNRPIKVGVSVSYRINDRLSLQSGITYAYLKSETTTESYDGIVNAKQKLHYVGVPLSVSYSLWHKHHFNAYVAGGGEVQKLVNGHANEKKDHYDGAPTTTKVDIHEHRPQFTVSAAAGVEYQFASFAGVFVEPNASYHFDNGSDVKNYYKDNQFNIGVGVGLRLHLQK